MWPRNFKLLPALLAFCLLPSIVGRAEETLPKNEEALFLQVTRDSDEVPVGMQVAIVRCVPTDCGKKGPTVDLVAAVHMADEGYYDELNKQFKKYDAVLFELVARKGIHIPKGNAPRSNSPLNFIQKTITRVLKLEYQLDGIDYTKENFVHADMTPDQFSQSMRDRGESIMQIYLRMFNYSMKQQARNPGTSDAQMLIALLSKDRALLLKRAMAEQFEDMEESVTAINGPNGSTIINERNRVALDVLRKQIKAGKRKLAIFYGAAHMSDFLTHLKSEFGLVPISTQWLTAWDLNSKKPSIEPSEKTSEKNLIEPSEKTSEKTLIEPSEKTSIEPLKKTSKKRSKKLSKQRSKKRSKKNRSKVLAGDTPAKD